MRIDKAYLKIEGRSGNRTSLLCCPKGALTHHRPILVSVVVLLMATVRSPREWGFCGIRFLFA